MCMGHGARAQDRALSEFIEAEQGFSTLHFYPSTIRMLGRVFGGVDASAFAELKGGRLMFTLRSDAEFKTKVATFLKSLESKDFENIAEMRNKGFHVRMLQKESNAAPTTLLYFDGEGGLYLLEAVGKLSPQALQQLMAMDVQSAASLFGLFPSGEKEEVKTDTIGVKIKIL